MTIETPQNPEAEESLIGCILLDASIFPLISLAAEEFYIHRWRYIWEAFTSLYQRGLAIDILTVTDELERQNKLKEIGGIVKLTELASKTFSTYNFESYAAIIRDCATRRKHIYIAGIMTQAAHNGGVDVAEVIDLLSDTGNADRQGRVIGQAAAELYDYILERSKNPTEIWGVPTGFIDIDRRTGGLHKQQTMMISGSPGVGKTTLMLQTAINAAKAGFGVAIFEAEMDEQRVLRRLIEIEQGITNRAMQTGYVKENDWPKIINAIEGFQKLNLFINDDPSITTAKIRTECAKLKARGKLDLVCLDYVELLKDKAGDGKDNNQNSAIKARRFREVCRSLNVAGLTVQSMTKEGMRSAVPQLADMSGPSEVHYGADTVFFLVEKDDEFSLLPAKQRDGDSGAKPIRLTRKGLPFYNYASESMMYPMSMKK